MEQRKIALQHIKNEGKTRDEILPPYPLKEVMQEKIEVRQKEKLYTLPEPKCVHQNHNLLAVHCEAKVAEEILDKKCFLMPDGTSRQGVGDIATSVVKVGDKIRALKSAQISSGTREN